MKHAVAGKRWESSVDAGRRVQEEIDALYKSEYESGKYGGYIILTYQDALCLYMYQQSVGYDYPPEDFYMDGTTFRQSYWSHYGEIPRKVFFGAYKRFINVYWSWESDE